MKIRSITSFVYIKRENSIEDIRLILKNASSFNLHAKQIFESNGYIVQTTRITTNSFEDYCENDKNSILNRIHQVSEVLNDIPVSYFSLGNSKTLIGHQLVPDILKMNDRFSLCSTYSSSDINLYETASQFTENVIRLSKETKDGLGNFNYTVCCCCHPFIPFYPASFTGESDYFSEQGNLTSLCFGIATENGDDINDIFSQSKGLETSKQSLINYLQKEYEYIESIANELQTSSYHYQGIDNSFNPGLSTHGSIANGIEVLMNSLSTSDSNSFVFGTIGTLTACRLLTSVCESINIKKTGYCGLMLPVLEDTILAQRYGQNYFPVSSLLSYSSVCGVGIDTLPLPCNTSKQSLILTYMDVYSLANKWNKQLSCRVFLCPNIYNGQMSDFNNPNLTNCTVHDL